MTDNQTLEAKAQTINDFLNEWHQTLEFKRREEIYKIISAWHEKPFSIHNESAYHFIQNIGDMLKSHEYDYHRDESFDDALVDCAFLTADILSEAYQNDVEKVLKIIRKQPDDIHTYLKFFLNALTHAIRAKL